MDKLSLINYEGDCLSAFNEDGGIVIVDQYRMPVDHMTLDDFYRFLDGSLEVKDSKGKLWNFMNEHHEARAKTADVGRFVQSILYTQEELNDAFVKGWELRHAGLSEELIIHEFVGFLNFIAGRRYKRRKNNNRKS
jgi:hypothetical protein